MQKTLSMTGLSWAARGVWIWNGLPSRWWLLPPPRNSLQQPCQLLGFIPKYRKVLGFMWWRWVRDLPCRDRSVLTLQGSSTAPLRTKVCIVLKIEDNNMKYNHGKRENWCVGYVPKVSSLKLQRLPSSPLKIISRLIYGSWVWLLPWAHI